MIASHPKWRISLQKPCTMYKPSLVCNSYRPRSEASKGYVFTGICLSIEVLYSGKQTDATAIDFQPIGDRLTNELWDFKVQWQWCLSVYHHGRAVRILLECILVKVWLFNKVQLHTGCLYPFLHMGWEAWPHLHLDGNSKSINIC